MRKIHIAGEITDESFVLFNRKLDKLESFNHESVQITLLSGGGDAYTALAFFDRIKASKCHIDVVATGLVASAATLILAAGDKRYMTKSSWIMTHEDQATVDTADSVSKIEKNAKHSRRLEDQWCKILASVTKTSVKKWDALNKAETYLTPEECLKLGLIEEIL